MPELLKRLSPVARKAHLCSCCHAVAVRPGERYDRSTYLADGTVYDWVICPPCKALAPLVWHWATVPAEGIGRDTYFEWATEMANDVVHGEAARAWLFRAQATTAHPPTSNTTTPAAFAESTSQKDV